VRAVEYVLGLDRSRRLTSSSADLGFTAGKATLMYATAVIGLRLSERRTLAQWSAIDLVAAVAVAAIVGRTAIASTQSFATGAVARLVHLALYRLMSIAPFHHWFADDRGHRPEAVALRICPGAIAAQVGVWS